MELILGTAQLADRYGVMATQVASKARAMAVLGAAKRLGVPTVDTAPSYRGAESAIGAAGAGIAVHTKLPSGQDPTAALAGSLRRLRREHVEVLYLHDPDVVLDPDNPQLATASALVGEGTKTIGASVYTRKQFLAAVADKRIAVVQAPMNVLDRSIADEDLRLAKSCGTDVIARSALLQGLLADPKRAIGRVPQLDETLAAFAAVCAHVGYEPLELALGWVRAQPSVSGMVVGAETPEQLEALVQSLAGPSLPDDVVALLASLPGPPGRTTDPRTWP